MVIVTPRVSLQLLGPAWTRTFRCLWMLEELLQPFHDASSSSKVSSATAAASSPPPFEYSLISSAKPTSKLVRQYVSTGKVPVLLVYHNHNEARGVASDFESQTSDTTTTVNDSLENSRNQERQPDLILSESSAINTYLADHYGGVALGLIPQSLSMQQDDASSRLHGQQRAIYDMVVSCISTELDVQELWMHSKHETMAQHFGHVPAAVSHARYHFVRMNAHLVASYLQQPALAATATTASAASPLDTTAAARLYLLGNVFTAADILYVHCLEWSIAIGWWTTIKQSDQDDSQAQQLRLSNAGDQQTLHDYYKRCRERPAFQRAAQQRKAKPISTTNHHPNSKL
jgi:glutathione S-transferase